MTRLRVLLIGAFLFGGFIDASEALADSDRQRDAIPAEDYALYDQVVMSKFLTSATQSVVIERMTRLRLSPDQDGATTIGAFHEQEYVGSKLPADLIREFIAVNRHPSRLERQFHFAVGYRFATGGSIEEPEVSSHRTLGDWRPSFCACPRQRCSGTGAAADVGASPLGSCKINSSAVGSESAGFLSRRAKPAQRSCAAVCRRPTSRRHRSRIPCVVPPSRTKLGVIRYGSRLDHSVSGRTRGRATACALMGLDSSMRSSCPP